MPSTNPKNQSIEKALTIAKSNAPVLLTPQSLVHIKHTINLQQIKYFYLLFEEMRLSVEHGIEPDTDGFYSMSMVRLSELIGYTPSKREVWADLEKLKNQTFAVNFLMKGGDTVKYGAGYIAEWAVSNSHIKFKFPSFFMSVAKNFIEFKKLFLQLNWEIFNSLTGKYEAIIYKLCKDYLYSGGKRTPNFTIDSFREYMGIKENEYQDFKALNRRCIAQPVKKINENILSDILVTANFIKTGKTITGLFFSAEHKSQQSLPIETVEGDSPFRFARVPIPPSLQDKYLKSHTAEEATLCIEAANMWIDEKLKAGETVNHGKAYRSALDNDWRPKAKADEEATKRIKATVTNEQVERRALAEKEQSDKEQHAKIWAEFLTRTEAEQDTFIRELLADKPTALKIYENKGKDAPLVRSNVTSYIKTQI